ncbi:citrate lyase [Croceicoccus estronivorus]|uniref:HpcH/HpaI aldolase/citrate lyase family protein n=1 Tax=Croceicoccus estronivorus TaxID=1172626 RepID=UPI000830BE49|nr:CoA ester lyase [Croceicoccus estronivorus]OCC23764.1 citrate lyase [Croceicoccus estronivorus]
MRLRSLLFVPGDRPDRMEKALKLGADALILDLEDAVAPAAKDEARAAVAAQLAQARDHGATLIVRVNPVDSSFIADDLAAILPASPDAIMLPKAEGKDSIETLQDLAGQSLPPLLPLTCETPGSVFELGSFRDHATTLCGLTWGAEDLASGIGAESNRDSAGALTPPFAHARTMTLFAAKACGVPAIETVHPDIRDEAGLVRRAARAAQDGFTGMMAIHPSQVPIINRAFTPDANAIARAQAIVDAFANDPGMGVLTINGKMVDAAHLKQAQALLLRRD